MKISKSISNGLILSMTALLWPNVDLSAQDDLLSELEAREDTIGKPEDALSTFKNVRLINLQTTETVGRGVFFFGVAHRFGSLQKPLTDFFGMDNAISRLTFTYGISDNLHVGASRSTFRKTYDIYSKQVLIRQREEGFPLTIALHELVSIDTQFNESTLPGVEFEDRLALVAQLLVAHRFDSRFSLLLNASLLEENTVLYAPQENTQFIIGGGARLRISKRSTIMAEYAAHLNRAEGSPFSNPLSVGWTIETGGHIFQLVLSGTQTMGERGVLGQSVGDWGTGDFYFGFNLIRSFN